jgi:rare lipoprotein A (peptidoglycan hydrolase)
VALIVVLALAVLPGAVGSRTPASDSAIDSTLFQRVDRALATRTATTTSSLDPTLAAAATLAPDSALVEPATAVARGERMAAVLPAPARGVLTTATQAQPLAIGTTAAPSGWRHDPDVSWYGPGFYGHRTACGKTLTTTLLGVAHKTLPCGTMVSFRNPANGQVVTVPVVDRGPYVAGRQWDLTGATCKAIAHCYTGPLFWRFA